MYVCMQVMLFGASNTFEDDKLMQITLAFNHFGQGLVQRMPRCRFGFVHVVNNDYTHWHMYAIGGSQDPTILSQGNRFIAPPITDSKEVGILQSYAQNAKVKKKQIQHFSFPISNSLTEASLVSIINRQINSHTITQKEERKESIHIHKMCAHALPYI